MSINLLARVESTFKYYLKGTNHVKKNVFFRALPKSPVMHLRRFKVLTQDKGPSASWFPFFACFAVTQLGCKASKLNKETRQCLLLEEALHNTRCRPPLSKTTPDSCQGRRLNRSTLYSVRVYTEGDVTAVRCCWSMAAP